MNSRIGRVAEAMEVMWVAAGRAMNGLGQKFSASLVVLVEQSLLLQKLADHLLRLADDA